MNTQLKRGDRFTSEFGSGEILGINQYTQVADAKLDGGRIICSDPAFLTRIIPHAERMQKIVDTVFAAENNFEDDQFIPMKVGDLAEFVRHYITIRESLDIVTSDIKRSIIDSQEAVAGIEKLLKGEL